MMRAFSLLEMLVAIALLGLFSSIVMPDIHAVVRRYTDKELASGVWVDDLTSLLKFPRCQPRPNGAEPTAKLITEACLH